jgi:hypothetical protein
LDDFGVLRPFVYALLGEVAKASPPLRIRDITGNDNNIRRYERYRIKHNCLEIIQRVHVLVIEVNIAYLQNGEETVSNLRWQRCGGASRRILREAMLCCSLLLIMRKRGCFSKKFPKNP